MNLEVPAGTASPRGTFGRSRAGNRPDARKTNRQSTLCRRGGTSARARRPGGSDRSRPRRWSGGSPRQGFVIEHFLGHLSAFGRRRHRAHHLRTSDGQAIDLLLELDGGLWAIETKLTSSPSSVDMSRLDRVADLVGATRRSLITQAATAVGDERRASADLGWAIERLREER